MTQLLSQGFSSFWAFQNALCTNDFSYEIFSTLLALSKGGNYCRYKFIILRSFLRLCALLRHWRILYRNFICALRFFFAKKNFHHITVYLTSVKIYRPRSEFGNDNATNDSALGSNFEKNLLRVIKRMRGSLSELSRISV